MHNHLVEPGVEGRKVTSHTSVARMNKYGAKGHPCLTDLASRKFGPVFSFIFTADVAPLYSALTHRIHVFPNSKWFRKGNLFQCVEKEIPFDSIKCFFKVQQEED